MQASPSQQFDCVIIGSGFGGSVAALRLAERGQRVLVLESGRRFRDQDFAQSNWNLRRFLFFPKIGLRGILRIDAFKGLAVLSGAGVGGGSLVYANTLIEPKKANFASAVWPKAAGVKDWASELAPYYALARKMLGATPAPTDYPGEVALQETATALGYGATFHSVDVGVYLGEPGLEVADPYFSGEGPRRTGCIRCGGCMVGCRYNAKNTLVKNYLWLAERRGARIFADCEADAIEPLTGGDYRVRFRRPGLGFSRRQSATAKRVIVAAGVLGTLRLLFRCRDDLRTLPNLSPALGREVRTNSESLLGVRFPGPNADITPGLAIAAAVHPDPDTKIEAVRYPPGSDALSTLSTVLVEGATVPARLLSWLGYAVRHPLKFIAGHIPFGVVKRTLIILVMQSVDNKLQFSWKRSPLRLMTKGLTANIPTNQPPPLDLPQGVTFVRKLAERVGGEPIGSIPGLIGKSATAHILGGCPMGRDRDTSVINSQHEVHGYPGLFVLGGAAIPANLGVNPSLTITAMAERAMAILAGSATPPLSRVRGGSRCERRYGI